MVGTSAGASSSSSCELGFRPRFRVRSRLLLPFDAKALSVREAKVVPAMLVERGFMSMRGKPEICR